MYKLQKLNKYYIRQSKNGLSRLLAMAFGNSDDKLLSVPSN